jgi:rod shape determining protein RodA
MQRVETPGLTYWSRRIDWPTMMAVGVLVAVGMVAVYSAVTPMGYPMRFVLKQSIAIVLGVLVFFLLSSVNYQLFRSHPGIIYGLTILALLAVLIIGRRIHGAKSWIVMGPLSFEPVEFAKLGYILVTAAVLDRPDVERNSLKLVLTCFALALGHMILILKEPYLGGAMVYVPVTLGMLFFSGVRPLYLLALVFYGAVAVGIPIISIYFSVQPQLLELHPILNFFMASAKQGRPAVELLFLSTIVIFGLWWFVKQMQIRIPWQYALFLSLIVGFGVLSAHVAHHAIKDYQRKRIVVFLSPGFDPLGAGYNILQSEIAVGSGRIFGKGLFSGSQTQLGFLPEKHTDFIFSVIGEEMGFMWACVIVAAFGLLVWRAFFIATESQDRFGSLVAAGIGCLFAFESMMNIGMVVGLLPVVGIALPFVSYGGSHMVTSLTAVGLLQSVNFRRYIY